MAENNLQDSALATAGATTVEVTSGAQHQSFVLRGADLTSGGSLSDTKI
jgi:hypothetical protein